MHAASRQKIMSTTQQPPPTTTKRWSSTEVAEYLSRWGVEEAVQQAVNSAIKQKAPDPVLHIAEFLEQKGHEMEATLVSSAPPTTTTDS
jgi:hypothetical protein